MTLDRHDFTRRRFIHGVGTTAGLLTLSSIAQLIPTSTATAAQTASGTAPPAAAGSSAIPDFSAAKIDWQQAKGTDIHLISVRFPIADALQEMMPNFQALTGFSVTIEQLPEDQFFNKLQVDFASGQSQYDAFFLNWVGMAQYVANGWVEPLEPYLNNPSLTDSAWYALDDFTASAKTFGTYQSRFYGPAVTGEWQVLNYRKDLFDANGLQAPNTMDDMYQAAVALNSPDVAGITNRLARSVGTPWPYAGYLRSYGSYLVDPDGNVQVNNPAGVQASQVYVKLLKDAGPAGQLTYGWAESSTDFAQGKAAMITDTSGFLPSLFADPNKSAVVGKVGTVTLPSAQAGSPSKPNVNHWMLGITTSSKNKTAAWLFIQWVTSRNIALEMAVKYGTPGGRASTWADPSFQAKYPYPDWIQACLEGGKNADPFALPQIIPYSQVTDVSDVALSNIYSGADAQTELNSAASKMQDILQSGG
jgi:multiple sugar transport system substrate-binding protein